MRTAAKVFIWIGMISGFYLIFPIIIGISALEKLDGVTSKKNLQNFGIITLCFCSILGGVFMILIANEADCKPISTAPIVKYEKIKLSEEEQRGLTAENAKRTTNRCIVTVIVFSGLCFIFGLLSCLSLYDEYGEFDFGITFILPMSIFQTALLAIPILLYYKKQRWVNKTCYIWFIVSAILLFFAFIVMLCGIIFFSDGFFSDIIALLTMISLLILTIIILCINRKTLNVSHKKKVITSELEIKLSEIERLHKESIITQDEYDKMRIEIINNSFNA